MRLYLAGPMRGIKDFNFPLFLEASEQLRAQGYSVFNPAERDLQQYGVGVFNSPTGDFKDIAHIGFSLRAALAADTKYICEEAEAIVLLPGWEKSMGAVAEKSLAEALGLDVFYY